MKCIDFGTFEGCWFIPFMWPFGGYMEDESGWDDETDCYVNHQVGKFAPTNLNSKATRLDELECRPDIAFMIKSKEFQEAIGSET